MFPLAYHIVSWYCWVIFCVTGLNIIICNATVMERVLVLICSLMCVKAKTYQGIQKVVKIDIFCWYFNK